jgi:hypothetical protein
MYKNSFVHYVTKVLVDVMFFGGILCCAAAPFAFRPVTRLIGYSVKISAPFVAILYSSAICALFILWQLKAMFKTLLGGNPFVGKNVTCLRKCSVASFIIAIIYIADVVLWFTPASSAFVIMFSLLGLFCLTLKDLFKQAIAYKEENDWTV